MKNNVVQMSRFRRQESTVGELRRALVGASTGAVAGMVLATEMADGTQRLSFTGKFRSDPIELRKMAHHLRELLARIELDATGEIAASA